MTFRRCLIGVVAACGCLFAAAQALASDLEARYAALDIVSLVDARRAVVELEALGSRIQPSERVRWQMLLAMARDSAGDAAGARQDANTLRTLADPLAQAAALLVLGSVEMTHGSAPAAQSLVNQAIKSLPASSPGWLHYPLVAVQAKAAESIGHAEEAVALYQRSIELADQMGLAWRQSHARLSLAWLYATLSEHDSSAKLMAEAKIHAATDGSDIVLSKVMNAESYRLAVLGDRAGSRAAQMQALALAQAAGSIRSQALMLANLADDYLRDGDYPAALAHAERALLLARRLNDPSVMRVAQVNRGFARVMLRQFEAGASDIEEVLAREEQRGDLAQVAILLLESATYFERAGDPRAAWSAYARRRPLAEQQFRKDQQNALLELQEGFEHKQRERELQALDQAGALDTAALQAQTLKLRFWLLAALAGAVALGLLAWLMLRQRQANLALQRVNADLQQLGEQDGLTGLANRRRLQRVINETSPQSTLEGSVFLVDIDHFKRVNDRHGHAVGDAVLIAVARRLQNAVRADDLVVRWGGEEFLVLARGIGAAEVRRMAQRMLDGIAGTTVTHAGTDIEVSISVGYARFPLDPGPLAVHWEQAIELIDAAMYLAKAHGRNRGYGVVDLQASNARELAAIATSLESSREHGRVGLQALQGPLRPGAIA